MLSEPPLEVPALVPVDLLVPCDSDWLTEWLVPSDTERPCESDSPTLREWDCDVLSEALSDSDALSPSE